MNNGVMVSTRRNREKGIVSRVNFREKLMPSATLKTEAHQAGQGKRPRTPGITGTKPMLIFSYCTAASDIKLDSLLCISGSGHRTSQILVFNQ